MQRVLTNWKMCIPDTFLLFCFVCQSQFGKINIVGLYCSTFNFEMCTAKKVSQIRTLKIITLFEHLKVFCLHTPSVLDFNTISCSQIIIWNTWCMQTEYLKMFEKCYNFQCSNLGHCFLQCGHSRFRNLCNCWVFCSGYVEAIQSLENLHYHFYIFNPILYTHRAKWNDGGKII